MKDDVINEYDKILIGVLVLIFGGLFTMVMRHAAKLAAHQRVLDRISGQLETLPSTAELVVRKIIEGHELREDEKFGVISEKLDYVRGELIGLGARKVGRNPDGSRKE